MASLNSLIPSGLLRFMGGRLLRAFVSLILFQIILFTLILALPESHSAQTEGEAMAQAFSQPSSQSSGAEEGEQTEDAQGVEKPPPPVVVRPPSAPSDDVLSALRESGSPEMGMLLDEAMGEDKRVALAEGSFIPTPAPAETEAAIEQATAPEGEGVPAPDQSQAEPVEAASAQQTAYEEGLTAIRPREKSVVEQFILGIWASRLSLGEERVSKFWRTSCRRPCCCLCLARWVVCCLVIGSASGSPGAARGG
jgi:type IV secretory pathway VirB10-like protein